MQWKHASSPSPQKFKLQAKSDKTMCAIFRDAESLLLIDFDSYRALLHWLTLQTASRNEREAPRNVDL